MNVFLDKVQTSRVTLSRENLKILQVNMGNLCNQSCMHCHVGASPDGKKVMSREVIKDIVGFLSKNKGLVLDVTGGAPELNPHFDYLVSEAKPFVERIMVRSNLTILFESGKDYLPEFFKKNKIHLICSLPCYTETNVDAQRGKGVFAKSIKALLLLNSIGYAKDKDLILDIVYNPGGAFLPGGQQTMENDYRKNLTGYGVSFNRLITITNVPIKRFKDFLDHREEYPKYIETLKESFNPRAAENVMCKALVSVGFDEALYDCDFNQSLGWHLKDNRGQPLTLRTLKKNDLKAVDILFGEHCFSCTAGQGSSCQGALVR